MADKIKKTPEGIKVKILAQLRNGPKATAEIGEAINSNWLTTEKFLKELKDAGLVIEIVSSPKMKVYKRADDIAFYGLPFSEQVREKSFGLLLTIAKKWRAIKEASPSRTMLQKIAVELIDNSDNQLNDIPTLRFHYGQTLAVGYEESVKTEYAPLKLTPKQDMALSKIIEKYKNMPPKKAQLEQYKKKGMEFYNIKEGCVIEGFNQPNFKNIENNFLKLSAQYPIELENTFELFEKFIYCSIVLLNLSNEGDKGIYLNRIKETFYLLWDTITTNYFFCDSEKHIPIEKKGLFNQIKSNVLNSKISNLSSVLNDLESEVNSINPEKINDSSSEKSQELLHELLEGQ